MEHQQQQQEDNPNGLYRECLRNHAASLGSYATDGCGEFTLDINTSPMSFQCAACGCHRNFHRKVTTYISTATPSSHHRDVIVHPAETVVDTMDYSDGGGRGTGKKRFRTKFTTEQKEKMSGFADKLGWKLQRKDMDEEVERFCRGVGISRQVFKVWMHNHKNSSSSSTSVSTCNVSSLTND